MFGSRYLPCPDCGASLEQDERAVHECEREGLLDYQLFQQRERIEAFASEFAQYLASPEGRFESWYAERDRRRAQPKGPPLLRQ